MPWWEIAERVFPVGTYLCLSYQSPLGGLARRMMLMASGLTAVCLGYTAVVSWGRWLNFAGAGAAMALWARIFTLVYRGATFSTWGSK